MAKATPGGVTNYSNAWIDQAWGVGVFTQPFTGKMYLMGSDIANGQVDRYRVDGLDTIQRQSNSFTWNVSVDLSGSWNFDDNLVDSTAHNDGVATGSTPTYVYGPQGKAIDLNGTNQSVVMPYSSPNTAYTLSVWVRPTNTFAVNIAAITGGGFLSGAMDQLRINKAGLFEHYTWDAGTLTAKIVTGTTIVQPNTWYLVTISAQNNGMMRLYVNGQEEGTAQSITKLQPGVIGIHVGDPGTVDTPNWLDGSVDGLASISKY